MCPSGAAFAIPLGPTNPSLIYIEKETLVFRCARFSLALRLLVPTFLLPHAPEALTGPPSLQTRMLSYRSHRTNAMKALNFGTMLKPRLSLTQNLSMSELLRYL